MATEALVTFVKTSVVDNSFKWYTERVLIKAKQKKFSDAKLKNLRSYLW